MKKPKPKDNGGIGLTNDVALNVAAPGDLAPLLDRSRRRKAASRKHRVSESPARVWRATPKMRLPPAAKKYNDAELIDRSKLCQSTEDSIEGVRKVLSGLDPNMKVETGTAVPLLGNMVAELCSVSILPTGLVVIVPPHPERPESVVKVERA